MREYVSGDTLSGYGEAVFLDENKKMTHRTNYGMMDNKPLLPRSDADLAIKDTTNRASETGLISRQPL